GGGRLPDLPVAATARYGAVSISRVLYEESALLRPCAAARSLDSLAAFSAAQNMPKICEPELTPAPRAPRSWTVWHTERTFRGGGFEGRQVQGHQRQSQVRTGKDGCGWLWAAAWLEPRAEDREGRCTGGCASVRDGLGPDAGPTGEGPGIQLGSFRCPTLPASLLFPRGLELAMGRQFKAH
ncbi:hypothetical protein THAOC_32337, partial [Thalassiosira oceanica]